MWNLVKDAVGAVWNKIPSAARWGIGGAAAVGTVGAVQSHGGIVGLGKDIVGGGAEISAHGGVEQKKNSLAETMNWLADILEALFGENNAASRMCRRFGERSLGKEEAEKREQERLGKEPLNSSERASQRIYETEAQSGPLARYRIDGPNGSPPSVELSDQPPSIGNSISLGFKGVKDGLLGVPLGWAGGLVAGAADLVGLDGSIGLNSDWAGKASRGISGAVNETTDFLVYDVAGKGLGGVFGLATGQGFDGFTQDYEPTVRSETDLAIYNGGSMVGTAVAGIATGYGLAAAGVGGATVATGGSTLGNIFRTAASGWKGLGGLGFKHAANVAGMIPMPGGGRNPQP